MGEAEAACIALYDPSDERLTTKFASGEKGEEAVNKTLVFIALLKTPALSPVSILQ